ncbi:MAG TPA: starch synthase [Cyanothece sp. UBA12306]|nr:starch synthase [Cyanothece sp. UBA12306]
MYIVQIASECAPVIKAGGLGDVVYGLSRELSKRGHEVELILPKYNNMRYDYIQEPDEAYRDLLVPWDGGMINCSVMYGKVEEQNCFFIDPQNSFFNRGHYYGSNDDALRFAFFSKAALEFLLHTKKRPDIIHCHDWQTGLVPVLLFEVYQEGMSYQRVAYSIHNFKHQGYAPVKLLSEAGLNAGELFREDRLMAQNKKEINLMKGGIVYSNAVNTVSPHYAWEARHTSEGYGLGDTLNAHQAKFKGILNGIDDRIWNPKVDTHIPVNYDIANFALKAKNKKALRERLWLRDPDEPTPRPIIAYIGRLDDQKGVHLVHHSMYYALERGAQFVLLGSPTGDKIRGWFQGEKNKLNDNPDVHLELSFNEELSHLIYAGADMMVVPSNYEPCGLTQMISLKYGTVPIVRSVGGLKNTVFDIDNDTDHPVEERNGYVFEHPNPPGLESALRRALDCWYMHRDSFDKLAKQGMKYDYSWKHPADEYLEVYDNIRHKIVEE